MIRLVAVFGLLASALVLFGARAGERTEPRLMTQCEFLRSVMRDAEHVYALGRSSYYRERWNCS